MKRPLLSVVLLLASTACYGQMTLDQKMVDFQSLAALFSKRYAFLEWKHDAIGFDGLKLAPWIERIKNSKDDLEFRDLHRVCRRLP